MLNAAALFFSANHLRQSVEQWARPAESFPTDIARWALNCRHAAVGRGGIPLSWCWRSVGESQVTLLALVGFVATGYKQPETSSGVVEVPNGFPSAFKVELMLAERYGRRRPPGNSGLDVSFAK